MEAQTVDPPRRRTLRASRFEGALRIATSTPALGALVFALTWGGGLAAPEPGVLDFSTHIGFHMALAQGLSFGGDVIFSYGPLGFLKTSLAVHEWPARVATLYSSLLHLTLSISLVFAARRSFPWPLALVAALVAAALMRGDLAAVAVRVDAAVVVLALIWCVAALDGGGPRWAGRLVLLAGGPFAAIELLAKPSTGIVVAVLVVATAVALEGDRRRNLATLAAAFLGPLAVLWFATGQGIGDIAGFAGGTWELARGYSSGARLEWGTRDYDYVLAPLVIAGALALALVATSGLAPLRRAVLLGMLALVSFTAFKSGFVSHEAFHMATFYATMLGACLAFRVPARTAFRAGSAIVVAGVVAAGFTTVFSGYPMTNPVENVRDGAATIATVGIPGRMGREVGSNRRDSIAAYRLDDEALALLEGRGVHVDPAEVAAVWAYELDWHPLPIFQPYAAWTESLDERNGEELASPDGPERILRSPESPLGRYQGFESPTAMRTMLCNFESLRTQGGWQVLGRVPDRCGEPRPLGSAAAPNGEPIPVPESRPGELVVGRAHGIQVGGLERLKATAYRADARRVSFDGGPEHVLVPETAGGDLLLRAPAQADFPDGFALAPNADEVTLRREGGQADAMIEIVFQAIPIEESG